MHQDVLEGNILQWLLRHAANEDSTLRGNADVTKGNVADATEGRSFATFFKVEENRILDPVVRLACLLVAKRDRCVDSDIRESDPIDHAAIFDVHGDAVVRAGDRTIAKRAIMEIAPARGAQFHRGVVADERAMVHDDMFTGAGGRHAGKLIRLKQIASSPVSM